MPTKEEELKIQVLRRAGQLLQKGWTQGAFARNANGDPVHPYPSHNPVCWCLVGAIRHASVEQLGHVGAADATVARRIKNEMTDRMDITFLQVYNDAKGRTLDEVLAAVNEQIGYYQGVGNANKDSSSKSSDELTKGSEGGRGHPSLYKVIV